MKTIKVLDKLYKVDDRFKFIFTHAITDELVVCTGKDRASGNMEYLCIDKGVDCGSYECVPIHVFEIKDPSESWEFKTNREPYIAEVFHDLSRTKPIGIIQNDYGTAVSVTVHASLYAVLPSYVQCNFKDVAGSSALYITYIDIKDLNTLITSLKTHKQPRTRETTFKVSYPGAK